MFYASCLIPELVLRGNGWHRAWAVDGNPGRIPLQWNATGQAAGDPRGWRNQ